MFGCFCHEELLLRLIGFFRRLLLLLLLLRQLLLPSQRWRLRWLQTASARQGSRCATPGLY